jgi:hypothetical protein
LLKIGLIHFFLNFFLNTATPAAPAINKSQVAGSKVGIGAVSSSFTGVYPNVTLSPVLELSL